MSATEKWGHLQQPFTVVFDSHSILSANEIKSLKEKDKEHHLNFVDAAERDFHAEEYGLSEQEAHEGVHVLDAGGSCVDGVDALEAANEAVGAGSYFRLGRGPGLRSGVHFGSYRAL